MPSFESHCEETERKFGQPFEKVHLWLDEFAGKPPHGMRHRYLRHHLEGIEEVRKMWGNDAANAARLHIESDLRQLDVHLTKPFPRNSKHYQELDLF